MISGRFLLSFQDLCERRGNEILDRVADEHPEFVLLAGGDCPLRTLSRLAVPAICAIRRLPTQRLHPCVPNGTFRIQSQPCAGD
jgi:hypothetical protein